MTADVLAPCVTSSSAYMALFMCNKDESDIILDMGSASDRQHYNVMSSLIG